MAAVGEDLFPAAFLLKSSFQFTVDFRDSFIKRDNNTDETREEDVFAMTSPHIAECEVALFFTVTYSFSLKSKLRKSAGVCVCVCIRVCESKREREGRERVSAILGWSGKSWRMGKSAVGKS